MDDGNEQKLGLLALDRFMLKFAMAQYEMKVNVNLGYVYSHVNLFVRLVLHRVINVTSSAPGLKSLHLADSESALNEDEELMCVCYVRAQQGLPDFVAVYDSSNQTVGIDFATFIVSVVPQHILPLYNFIMSTFVPKTAEGKAKEAEPEKREVQETVGRSTGQDRQNPCAGAASRFQRWDMKASCSDLN